MPLYRTRNGDLVSRSADYVAVFPDGSFTKIDDESPAEARERERLEALENKVDIENTDYPEYDPSGSDGFPTYEPPAYTVSGDPIGKKGDK